MGYTEQTPQLVPSKALTPNHPIILITAMRIRQECFDLTHEKPELQKGCAWTTKVAQWVKQSTHGRREPNSESCPLMSTHVLRCACTSSSINK